MTQATIPTSSLVAGDTVSFLSGRRSGSVRDIVSNGFEVLRDNGSTVWLTNEAIYSASHLSVVLICEERGMVRFPLSAMIGA